MINEAQMKEVREQALNLNQRWKAAILARDAIASDLWTVKAEKGISEESRPLVENVYNDSLYDKVLTAAGRFPMVETAPTRGTRNDRAEKNAQKRYRVFMSYVQRSGLESLFESLLMDYYHAAGAYLVPWADFFTKAGGPMPAEFRHPYLMRLDPRTVYPVAHDKKGRLSCVVVSRERKFKEIVADWGPGHPAVATFKANLFRGMEEPQRMLRSVHEVWYYDDDEQAVALFEPGQDNPWGFGTPLRPGVGTGPRMAWLAEPEKHRLDGCPVAEAMPTSHNGSYRSPLESTIPALQTAQDFMFMYLDNLAAHAYTTTVVANADVDQFGPGQYVEADDPSQPVQIEHDNPPSQIEVTNAVVLAIQAARRSAKHPDQRSGDPGMSIGSDKALNTLQGSFNADLGSAQKNIARLISGALTSCANFDAEWCDADKTVDVTDGRAVTSERYRPSTLFRGDYRNAVTYGATLGLDENAKILRLSAFKNMIPSVFGDRAFAREVGIEDLLQEEREAFIERWLTGAEQMVFAQAFQGNMEAWDAWEIADRALDADDDTLREAVRKMLNSVRNPVPAGAPASAPGAPSADPAVRQSRSLAAGGAPGSPGQPVAGQELIQALGPGVQRTMSEIAPGGTAA